jgi:hypothetical protein
MGNLSSHRMSHQNANRRNGANKRPEPCGAIMTDESDNGPHADIALRIFGMDADNKPFSTPASATLISGKKVRVRGICVCLEVGGIIGAQCGTDRHRFRVEAFSRLGTSDVYEVDLDCIDADRLAWTAANAPSASGPQPASTSPSVTNSLSSNKQERRRFQRYPCDIGANIQIDGTKRLWARCTDISTGGCYLETWSPLPVGTTFNMELDGIPVAATVKACHPNVGMGVRFETVSAPRQMAALIENLRRAAAFKG